MRRKVEEILEDRRIDWFGFLEKGISCAAPKDAVKIPALDASYLPLLMAMLDDSRRALRPMRESKEDARRFTQAVIALSALFPIQDLGEEGFGLRQALLNRVMEDYPISVLEEACTLYARTGEWFPKPKDLIEIADRILHNRKRTVEKLIRLEAAIDTGQARNYR